MKRLANISQLLKNKEFTSKIYIYFSTRTRGADYDPYEKNYTYTNLNPQVIQGIVREIDSETLVWKQIGLKETGAKEILCDEKYADWFRNCTEIKIDGDTYHVYKEHVGSRAILQQRPYHVIRVIVSKD